MIQSETRDQFVVVRPEGDLVASMAGDLRAALLNAIGDGTKDILIDLELVRLIDSMGISTLIAANNTLSGRPGALKLVNVNDDIRSLFRLMRLDQHIRIG